jgi:bifunctional non-homologous end joining protein LigD
MLSSTFLDESGRPSFNALQNSASGSRELVYYIYDVMVIAGKDVMSESFEKRRELLEKKILPKLKEPVRYSSTLNATLPELIRAVKASGLEGLVAKRADSPYEPNLRTGKWQKMRVKALSSLIRDRRLSNSKSTQETAHLI